MGVPATDPLTQLSLPPGFRFYPTDEELLVQYLCRKVAGHHFNLQIIGDIDLYKFDPWDLPSKAIFGEKEWYFFSPRDRKYPNGSRPNRVAGSGYWKATGTDKVITTEGRRVGIKKALVFYIGKAPKGTKTNWIMHEYRLLETSRRAGSTKLDDWVLCRIYKKNSSSQNPVIISTGGPVSSKEHSHASSSSSSSLDDMLESLPEIDDRFFALPRMNSLKAVQHHQQQQPHEQKPNLQSLSSGAFDWATLAGLSSGTELNQAQAHAQAQAQAQAQPQVANYANSNDVYVPAADATQQRRLGNSTLDEEVQSGLRTHQHVGMFQQTPGLLTQSMTSPIDTFGYRYPAKSVGFGFHQ
ncbi:hypothetical protein CRG98_041901 [Punica granatum]|uniref:NAC domain-containing protein n=1 Tax=Punica granatum TaxID=22663 RepID=A0A2I0I0X5_PUNGR|nr:hypothetical protein CRG98_041901 [Punica granatum]